MKEGYIKFRLPPEMKEHFIEAIPSHLNMSDVLRLMVYFYLEWAKRMGDVDADPRATQAGEQAARYLHEG